jgi:hypothetical protein
MSFRVHDDLYAALAAAAEAEGRTVSNLLTQISVEYVRFACGIELDRFGRKVPETATPGRKAIGAPEGKWLRGKKPGK